LIKKLWNITWDMWLHRNSALHETEMGTLLIVDGDTKQASYSRVLGRSPRDSKRRNTTFTTTTATHCQRNESLQRPMARKSGCCGTKILEKQEAGMREQRLMESWVGYQGKS